MKTRAAWRAIAVWSTAFLMAFLAAGAICPTEVVPALRVRAEGLSFLRETPEAAGAINPGDFKKLSDALQGKVKVVDLVNFGRLRFLSWPARSRLSYDKLDRFTDFPPLRPPAALDGFRPPVVERVGPLKVQFALKVKTLNKLLASLEGAPLLPGDLEGRTFTLSTSAELRFRYPSKNLKRRGDLLLSMTRDPVLEVPAGVDLNQVRLALLALPGWPEPMRRQFAAVPVNGGNGQAPAAVALDPVSGGEAERVSIHGKPGVFLSWETPRGLQVPPEVVEARRRMAREAEESGDPWAGHPREGNTLIWHQEGLLLSLTGDGLTLAEAKAIAEMVR
ncbi:MAG TPA: hypothetical protein GXX28_00540 [Firmicutes bacterium]|nr:hypothetical protein [Bacillota bacterium]